MLADMRQTFAIISSPAADVLAVVQVEAGGPPLIPGWRVVQAPSWPWLAVLAVEGVQAGAEGPWGVWVGDGLRYVRDGRR